MIRIERTGRTHLVTLDRPPVNGLDAELYEALKVTFNELSEDAGLRVVVLASAQPGIFAAGMDLKQFATRDRSPEGLRAHLAMVHASFGAVAALPVPSVAAIEGHALGGGCELALCCDFRIMARGRARIGIPEITLGLAPGGGGTQRLARLVGRTSAARMAFLGQRLDADAAAAIGLVEAVDEGHALESALDLAERLAAQAPGALRRIKRALVGGLEGSLAEGLALEREMAILTSGGDEAMEGVNAFLEKRPPAWAGGSESEHAP